VPCGGRSHGRERRRAAFAGDATPAPWTPGAGLARLLQAVVVTDASRISPTAHYTSAVWVENGLSPPALGTPLGQALHAALAPMNAAYRHWSARPNLDMMLLARHRVLDHLLARAVESGRIGQVVELAAGLSGRGYRFAHRFPGLRYIETDLPDMAAHKRRMLDDARLRGANHEVVPLDAVAAGGPGSLAALVARLDPARGLAVVTEGLVGYLDRPTVEALWRRIATVLGEFPHGLYLSDLNLAGEVGGMRGATVFRAVLSAFTRGRVYLHYASAAEAARALRRAGFRRVHLHRPGDVHGADVPGRDRGHVVRIAEAVV
jgi:O-methyltransferase involved in polyketide biosynthesis